MASHAGVAMRKTESHMFAFLRRHYPDQVRGTGRRYVSSQPACASTPWIVRIFYHGCRFLSSPKRTGMVGEVSDKLRKFPARSAGNFLLFREVRNETGSVGFSGRTFPSYDGCAGPGPGWPRRAADATASCRSGCRGRWCGGADPAPDSPASGPQTAGPRSSCRPG